jgi:predicted nucleic acid-binding protein
MNLVDSCGWLEYFSDGPNADFFSFPLFKIAQLVVPTICIYEVFNKILIERDENHALQAIAVMKQGLVVDMDTSISLAAAKISFEFKLPMADSLILATSREMKAIIWTQDEHFKNLPEVKFRIKRGKRDTHDNE